MTGEAEHLPFRSRVLKSVFAARPWLFITASSLYSNPGLAMEDLKELTGLVMDALKRSIWWLKKYSVIEEKGGRYFLKTEYMKAMEELHRDHCNLGGVHVLLLDRVYVVLTVRKGRVHYWSLPAEYYEKLLYYEVLTDHPYSVEEIASILRVDESTAKKVERLRELLKHCKTTLSSAGRGHAPP
ncbi:MAG: hypothetical protein QXY82_07090 [Desulfurococcaceae archaeon]